MSLEAVAILLGAWLLGSLPTAVILGQLAGVDVRNAGSGNPGATNVARTAGRGLGLATLLLDAAKGAVPVLLASQLQPGAGDGGEVSSLPLLAALGAVLGHIFPPALGFRGGKGVATALGAVLALAPQALVLPLVVFASATFLTGFVSLGSILGALVLPAGGMLADLPPAGVSTLALIAALIVWRHSGNIARLRKGTEARL